MTELMVDEPFYGKTGGVTLSGGEPTAQAEFCIDILTLLRMQNIHTAIDTSGQCDTNKFLALCKCVDLVLFDLKHMDTKAHKKLCGIGNELILMNLSLLCETGKDVEIRVPIIKDINDHIENIEKMIRYISDRKAIARVVLLKYHKLGLYKPVGFSNRSGILNAEPPSDRDMESILLLFKDALPEVSIIIR